MCVCIHRHYVCIYTYGDLIGCSPYESSQEIHACIPHLVPRGIFLSFNRYMHACVVLTDCLLKVAEVLGSQFNCFEVYGLKNFSFFF